MRLSLLLLVCLPALAQEQDVQRSLIMRDQQSAQFAARVRGATLAEQRRLENLAAQQLLSVTNDLPQALRPYERQSATREHGAVLPPPVRPAGAADKPRPLPAKMPGVVAVIPLVGIDSPAGALQGLTQNR